MNWDLLSKYMTKNATKEETESFQRLISESDEDKKVYEAARKVWEESSHFAFEKDYDVDKEWQSTRLMMKKDRFIKKYMYAVSRYAAVFVLALVASYLIFMQQTEKSVPVAWHEIYVPKGEQTNLTLADGTQVKLNAETRFAYPSDFSATNRVTKLNGEAFFDVVTDPENPFEVNSKHQKIKVFGTKFNINAYEQSKNTTTTLLHGKVNIYSPTGTEIARLQPNQKSVLNHRTRRMTLHAADPEIDAGWKDGIYYFKSIPFEELAQKLERWYGVGIIVTDEKLKNERFTGKFFHDQSVWQALDLLKLTMSIDYQPGQRTIRVYYKNN